MITTVITTKNEYNNLRKSYWDILKYSDELILVDCNSTDGTKEFLERFPIPPGKGKVIYHEGNQSVCRNIAIKEAKGDIIAFLDGDAIPDGDWLLYVEEDFKNGADVVYGPITMKGRKAWEKLGRYPAHHNGQDCSIPTANIAYRKTLLDKLNGFDESYIAAEDMDLNYRAIDAGAVFKFEIFMGVTHKTRDTIIGFAKQAYRNGRGRRQLVVKYPSISSENRTKLRSQLSFWKLFRLGFAGLGYVREMFNG